jgi:DegV family protein with EDD domain
VSQPGRVAVVTDSTAYLPASFLVDASFVRWLRVVPLQVVLDGRSRAEGLEVTSGQVAEALVARRRVTTSRPAPAQFAQTYRELAAQGAGAVVSVHLSGELSGTVAAARSAAAEVALDGIDVEVVDSRSLGLGLAFATRAAMLAADRGAGRAKVAEAAARSADAGLLWLYVDTLDYLRRGGRISPAAAMVGSALAVKPLLHLVDGRLELFDRVRTASRALARLEDVVVAAAGQRRVDVGVQHLAARQRAEDLAAVLRARIPGVHEVFVSEVGAVVGAHVGPGMVGVVLAEAPSG